MKKISLIIIAFFILNLVSGCSGYKPIFSSSNLNFEILYVSIEGDEKIGKEINNKLKRFLNTKDKNKNKSINLYLSSIKDKVATVKDSSGKIKEYKITLNTRIKVDDYLTDQKILDQNFSYSTSYKVQDNYSETIDLENKSIENLLNRTFQEIIIKLTESMV
tara:strand:- start:3521 stop:4006 length:486 start_codon:yes stop_codon:yes gene_type:complete